MPTDKNKISAYLSEPDFRLLEDLSAQYRCSKSQVVILAIRALAGQSLEVAPINPSSGVNSETMELLVKDEVNQAIAAALAPISEDLENLKKLVSGLLSSPPPLPLETKPIEPMESLETIEPMEAVEAIAPAPKKLKPGEGLSANLLAERFEVDPSSIHRAWKADKSPEPRPDHFREWSKGKDPENIAWEKKGDKFFPVSD